MIIKIHNSAIKCIENEKDMNGQTFVEDLCTARRLGLVVIDSSKKNLLKISELKSISDLQRNILRSICSELTFTKELLRFISYRILFFNSNYVENELEEEANIFIDIRDYYNNYSLNGKSIFNLPKIVVEDISDFDVYKSILKWYFSKNKTLENQTFKLEMTHGGGDRSADVCNEHHENGYFVYCICDSDKKYPSDAIGGTSKKLIDHFNSIDKSDNLLVLDVHEVENLIPFCILKKTAQTTQLPAISFIEHAVSKSIDVLYYLDLKNGLNYKDVLVEESEFSRYWRYFISDYNCDFTSTQIKKIQAGEIDEKANITVRLSSMLPHAINNLSNSNNKVNKHCPLESFWYDIGMKLWAWGCGSRTINI